MPDAKKWMTTVSDATKHERVLVNGTLQAPLLVKEPEELLTQHAAGLSVVRTDEDGEAVAHATLWQLHGNWYELGTVWVRRDRRGHDLSAELYRELFARHPHLDILATTVNRASLRIGIHVGMVAIPYHTLPHDVWRETCCCSFAKTGSVDNVRACRLRETSCFVRVTSSTWERLGHPDTIDIEPFAAKPRASSATSVTV